MEVAFIILSIILFVFSIYIGFQIAHATGKFAVTIADYWKMNAAAIVVAVIAAAVVASLPLLYSVVIGLLAGYIVGLKMVFGESTGPWKVHDAAFNVNRSHRDTAARGGGEERRARRRAGEGAPDVISVTNSKQNAKRNAR